VWLDALINYLTALGYPDEDAMVARGRAWPADVHVVGKDILKLVYIPTIIIIIIISLLMSPLLGLRPYL
jgi:methionyl-tRNA synthetase